MNDFTFTKEAFEDYLYWQVQDKKIDNYYLIR